MGFGHRAVLGGSAFFWLDQEASLIKVLGLRLGIPLCPPFLHGYPTPRETSMTHTPWILVPWAVFLGALVLKFWQLGIVLRRYLRGPIPSTESFRQTLERIWRQNQQAEPLRMMTRSMESDENDFKIDLDSSLVCEID